MPWYVFFLYSVWFFIPPVTAFAFCDLLGMAGAPAGEKGGKNIETSLLSVSQLDNQSFHFLLEVAHIFFVFSFIINVPIEAFLILLYIPGQV